MKCNIFFKLIFCFTLLFGSEVFAANFSNKEAETFIYDKGNKLLDAFAEDDLAKKYTDLDNLFLEDVDLDYISKFVMGKYWRQMNLEQQQKFQALFKRYALGVYKNFPLSFKNRIKFKVSGITNINNYKDVETEIDTKEFTNGKLENIFVTFRLDKKEDKIKIIDIKITESSLILSYRNQFYQMVMDADEDMTWFLEDFETLTISTETNNKLKLEEIF